MVRIILFLSVISCALAAVAIYPAKEGEEVSLSLGPNIKTWSRQRDGQKEKEFIKHCEPTEKNIQCAQFATESGEVLEPKSSAKVLKDGTLQFTKVSKSDAGQYSSMDEAERVIKNPDGSFSGTPRTAITLQVN